MTSRPDQKANIDMLSQLLTDSLGIPDPEGRVRAELEAQANDIWKHRFSYSNDLGIMNKLILARTVATFQPAISATAPPIAPPTAPPNKQQSGPVQKFPDKRYQEHKKNFIETINATRPTEIDFRDNVEDDPINTGTVDATMKAREAELKSIMSNYESAGAKEWLTSEASAPPNNIKIDRDSRVPTDMVPIQNVEKKHVTFNIEEPTKEETSAPNRPTLNLLSKLKRVPSSDVILQELLANQKIILERLESIEKCIGTTVE